MGLEAHPGPGKHRQSAIANAHRRTILTDICFSAPRHFRDAHTTYDAMVEMLKNANHQYDDTVVKALLYTLSLYPIGAYVYLSNGKIAQVVDVNPSNQRNPLVQIIGETEPDGSPKTAQTNDTNLKIIRVMNKAESDDVLKAIKNQTTGTN